MSLTFKSFSQLFEHHANPNVTMTLQQVIDAGKITNTVQVVIMSQLIASLKNSDDISSVRNYMEFPVSNTDSIRNLPASDQVELAKNLLLQISPGYHIGACETDPCTSTNAWVNRALQHQK